MDVGSGPPLVGRRTVLRALRAAAEDAVAGRGGLVLLTGDPGIGKTALARAVAEHAAAGGARCVWATCWDGEGAPGLWPWAQVLRALEGDADGVLRQSGEGATARFQVFDAVTGLLRGRARERPLVVVLDDLHRADPASVRLLGFAARAVAAEPVLLVGTYRDVEVAAPGHPLAELLPAVAEGARALPLGGLDRPAVAELLRRLAGELPEHLTDAVHRRTGGNPFFVQQLAQLVEGRADPAGALSAVPPVVGDVVARRLAALPQPTRDLLDAGCVVGIRFDLPLAAAVTGTATAAALAAVDAAVRARVVAPVGGGVVAFEHDLFREVLYARLPADRRARLHLAVAERLEARGDSPVAVASHRAAALPLGDRDRAVAALVDAGRDAVRRGAVEEAADSFRRAVEAPGEGPPPAPGVLVEYATALRRAGRPDAAYAWFRTAFERARAGGDADILAAAALGASRVVPATDVGHPEVVVLIEEALAATPADPGRRRCLLLAALARKLSDGPDRDEPRAGALVREAVREARALEDPAVLAAALEAQVEVTWRPGAARECLRLTDELEAVAAAAGEQELVLEARLTRAVALLELADPAWWTALDEYRRLAEELRLPHHRYMALSRRATGACLTGPVDAAEAAVGEAAAFGERIGEPDAWGVRAGQLLGLALLHGEWSRVQAVAEACGRPLVPSIFTPLLHARLHLERGERAAAAALVAGLGDLTDLGYRWRRTMWLAELAEIAVAVGDRQLCAWLYRALLPGEGTFGVLGGAVCTTGPVALQLGELAAALGRPDDAVAHLENAVTLAERLPAPLHVVRCRAALATALLARDGPGEGARARRLLDAVADDAGRLGLTRLAEDARRRTADLDDDETAVFRREGDVWTLTYAGRTVRLRDAKGLRDLARLLAAPGAEVPATELLGLGGEAALGADPVLDDRARAAYRQRLAELEARLARADAAGDAARGARLTEERDTLVRELARASGLGGRHRRLGDLGERARSTVSARIRDSLRHVEEVHPELGAHLRGAVLTGTRCCYRPARPVRWRV